MTKVKVRLDALVYGDMVEVAGQIYTVSFIDGPDLRGVYDVYLIDHDGALHHRVIAGGVDLLYEQAED